MILGVRLAVWGSAEEVERAVARRGDEGDAPDDGDDGLAEAAAQWGLRLED